MEGNMEIMKDFLIYLDSEGILNELRACGLCYENHIKNFLTNDVFIPPFRFILKVDALKIHELSHILFALLVWEPEKFMDTARNVILLALRELTELKYISLSDIQIIPDITSFPDVSFTSEKFQMPSKGLQALSGILIGCSAPYKYTRSLVYFCKRPQCPVNNGERCRMPCSGVCSICGCRMEEDIRSTDIGDEITGQVIELRALANLGRFQSVRVKIRDELCSRVKVQIGAEYNVIGIFEGSNFNVWNICSRLPQFEVLTNVGSVYALPIPTTVARLYYEVNERCPNSPWSFVGAIATSFASDAIPISSLLQLRMGLVLSLATQNLENPPVSLVAVGGDSRAAQKLMNSAGHLAERFLNYTAGCVELGGEKRRNARDDVLYEAGALILAANGVCNAGDWSQFRKDQCNHICQVVESGKIILTSAVRSKTDEEFVPLKCSVWTHWCHISQSNQDQRQLRTLLNVFGMPFLADESDDEEAEKLAERVLQVSTNEFQNSLNESTTSSRDLKDFISLVNSRHLSLTESASKLIHDFFVLVRKERPECLPIGTIKHITSLAEAHARLSLRNEIIYEDVIAVLHLYNESISRLFGHPFIECKLSRHDKSEPIYKQVHDTNEDFKYSLEEYIENYLFL